jgi:hypothetical protein
MYGVSGGPDTVTGETPNCPRCHHDCRYSITVRTLEGERQAVDADLL